MITLFHYLVLSAVVFCVGLFGALTRRNAISVLMSVELMFNAANIAFVAVSYRFTMKFASQTPSLLESLRANERTMIYHGPGISFLAGQVFPLFVIAVAASEVAVGLALVLALYRNRAVANVDEADEMRG